MELLMWDLVNEALEKTNIGRANQHGRRERRSCQITLMAFFDEITSSLPVAALVRYARAPRGA